MVHWEFSKWQAYMIYKCYSKILYICEIYQSNIQFLDRSFICDIMKQYESVKLCYPSKVFLNESFHVQSSLLKAFWLIQYYIISFTCNFEYNVYKVQTAPYWIDFTDIGTKGKWVTFSTGKSTYTSWRKGQPNNYKCNQDCPYTNF